MPHGTRFAHGQGAGEDSWGSARSSPWHSLCGDSRVQPSPVWCQLRSSEGLCWHRGRAGSALSVLSLLYFMKRQHIFLLSWFYLSWMLSLSHSSVLPLFCHSHFYFLLSFPFFLSSIHIAPECNRAATGEIPKQSASPLKRGCVFCVSLITVPH